jgi:hypothetical protein
VARDESLARKLWEKSVAIVGADLA